MPKEKANFDVLGLPISATEREIKSKYHELAKLYHPDKNSAPNARDDFERISRAYKAIMKEFADQNISLEYANAGDAQYITLPPLQITASDTTNNDCIQNISNDVANNIITNDDCKYHKGFKNIDFFVKKNEVPLDFEIKKNGFFKYQPQETMQPNLAKSALLWLAQKPGCAPIYIFGTMHRVGFDPTIFDDVLKNTIDKVDVVFTEIDEQPDLKNTKSRKMCLDARVTVFAICQNKRVMPLEDDEIRESLGVDLKYAIAAKDQLMDAIDHQEGRIWERFYENSQRYLNNSMKEDPDVIDIAAVTTRNHFWLQEILAQSSAQTSCLVAVGANHNIGPNGLPNLLAQQGYAVSPLMQKAPSLRQEELLPAIIHDNEILSPMRFFTQPITVSKPEAADTAAQQERLLLLKT